MFFMQNSPCALIARHKSSFDYRNITLSPEGSFPNGFPQCRGFASDNFACEDTTAFGLSRFSSGVGSFLFFSPLQLRLCSLCVESWQLHLVFFPPLIASLPSDLIRPIQPHTGYLQYGRLLARLERRSPTGSSYVQSASYSIANCTPEVHSLALERMPPLLAYRIAAAGATRGVHEHPV